MDSTILYVQCTLQDINKLCYCYYISIQNNYINYISYLVRTNVLAQLNAGCKHEWIPIRFRIHLCHTRHLLRKHCAYRILIEAFIQIPPIPQQLRHFINTYNCGGSPLYTPVTIAPLIQHETIPSSPYQTYYQAASLSD